MRYKIGDRVKIKTWVDMKKEFGLKGSSIAVPLSFTTCMEILLESLPDRILTIQYIGDHSYRMEGTDNEWGDEMIEGFEGEGLAEEIDNRFEILDI